MPVLDVDGLLHFGANWEAYAVDASTGETVWRKLATVRGISYFGPGHASALVFGERVFHRRVFNGVPQSAIQSFDRRTGKDLIVGGLEQADFPGQRQASIVPWNGKLLTVSNGLVCFAPDDLNRALFWSQGGGAATPAVQDDIAYVSYHRIIRAHDLKDQGRVIWETPHEGARYQFSGGVDWVDVRRENRLPAGNFSAPLVAGDAMVVCDTGGHLRCLATADGAERWRITLGDAILCAPIISGNSLYIGDYSGKLHAFSWADGA